MTSVLTQRPALSDLIDDAGGRVACLAMSKDPNAKVTILLFGRGGDVPTLVAKVPTTDAAERSVRLEKERLVLVADAVLGPVGSTIPQVVAVAEHMGRPVLVTTALPGRLMLASYHSWRHTARPAAVQADFDAAGSWLAELQSRTSRGAGDLTELLDDAAETIARRFGHVPVVTADLDLLGALRERLTGQEVPLGVIHGDFWPGNLLIDGGRVCGVIDWESARPDGPLVRDLSHFAITYSMYLDRHAKRGRRVTGHPGLRAGRWGAGVDHAIEGTGWYPELMRRFMTRGLASLGLSEDRWRDFLLAEIVCMAAEADHPGFALNHLLLFRRLKSASV